MCFNAAADQYFYYSVSMQIAKLSQLPTMRKQRGSIIVIDCTSCRNHIADGAAQ